jgi:hypothetical protein
MTDRILISTAIIFYGIFPIFMLFSEYVVLDVYQED